MYNKPLLVRVEWDDEACVWVASSDDIPGLATESDKYDSLLDKLRIMIPELISLNGLSRPSSQLSFEVFTRRFETLEYGLG